VARFSARLGRGWTSSGGESDGAALDQAVEVRSGDNR